ncbi:hypothetical protein M8Z33_07390 [Streptomyces sp. ZAF1911]|uniref:hypothetical protein n=1 Tax=Streptomyces sp. ZAF1911 TaxID=2944129 RepID=UPI00237BBA05|nr:hypothetical protein [Streptomyces sp. ZAF1911]MDD9376497.1 hypothetical protein [Streptomyces sp. ZAF1911]
MSRIAKLRRRPAYRVTRTGYVLHSVPARPLHTSVPGADEIALRNRLVRMGVGR